MTKSLQLQLERAPGEPSPGDEPIREQISEAAKALRAANITFSQSAMAFDSVGTTGYPLADFLITTLGPDTITALRDIAIAWIAGHYGRKAVIQIGSTRLEGKNAEELGKIACEIERILQEQRPKLPKE